MNTSELEKLCRLVRYDILNSTTAAGSGHPTSSLSAVELAVGLFFGGYYHYNLNEPGNFANDRFILSKGHASPLLYSLYHAAGAISYKNLLSLRKFGSVLEGHPNPRFLYADVATGSLGQGLSNGVGMALGIRMRVTSGELKIKRLPKVWVMLGDSEMAEGQVWEAMEIASYYKLGNLVGIIDVNRLGQQGETEAGWDIHEYRKKAEAFGWKTIVVEDGHNLKEITAAFEEADKLRTADNQQPTMIIARTVKGKGVSFLEDKENWHGKALNEKQLAAVLKELGKVDVHMWGKIEMPNYESQITNNNSITNDKIKNILNKLNSLTDSASDSFPSGFDRLEKRPISTLPGSLSPRHLSNTLVSTRKAFGDSLAKLGLENKNVVVLDAEVANSTFENEFRSLFPERFLEMFIAEENMMGAAVGLSKIGYIPYVSTFAAFMTQTFDQIRMAQYGNADLIIVGSHAGVSIGQDGPSQMGLEDIAMMRSVLESTVLYPSDAQSAAKLTRLMAGTGGIIYLRTTRADTPVIYGDNEMFEIGGFKEHKVKSNIKNQRAKSKTLIIGAGITLHEALKAQKILNDKNIIATVVDLYCIKPLDNKKLKELIAGYQNVIVAEDHYPDGGIGDAITSFISNFKLKISNYIHLCVRKTPMSGTPAELLKYEEIDCDAIVNYVNKLSR